MQVTVGPRADNAPHTLPRGACGVQENDVRAATQQSGRGADNRRDVVRQRHVIDTGVLPGAREQASQRAVAACHHAPDSRL
ncbi:hypothetical protein [Allobranchiibius sp. GilTou38]|uniref:hypothetical protein n=1 Tax=Allobranchiibius sp. GilTou38 TaxID=2815210 RepID=UPI001AA0DF93|nr:hypothetical protein [Allobranchiibius sp. GilTou38]MBO1766398.1 hypothetical protein [Allobranchiibius sp. GilTou38]